MPAFVKAWVDRLTGWVKLRFPYDLQTLAVIKTLPGTRWDPEEKCWWISYHGWEVLKDQVKHTVLGLEEGRAVLPPSVASRLRPYQVDAANFLIANGGALNTSEQRTGKSASLLAAASALMQAGRADCVILLYPNIAFDVWKDELKKWIGVDLLFMSGQAELPDFMRASLQKTPWLVVGCHYEILGFHRTDLEAIIQDRRAIVIADEIQLCKGRSTVRGEVLRSLATNPNVIARWGSTGTPMRNRSRDLWMLFEFTTPGSMGGYWTYAKRYCGAVETEHGWEDDGNTNQAELTKRLATISYRITRAEAAPWLPKVEYRIIHCNAPARLMEKYRRTERAFALQLRDAVHGSDSRDAQDALKQLAELTSVGKIPTAMERVKTHMESGFKIVVFAHFHETLRTFEAIVRDSAQWTGFKPPPIFTAGGWVSASKRAELIASWKKVDGPAILLANSLSSQVAIDLSDAAVATFLEPEWVPADFDQVKDRLVDVHLGKRTAPPIIELLVVRGTTDEDMATVLIPKMRAIADVVGGTQDGEEFGRTLMSAELVDSTKLGLPNTDSETVKAALAGLAKRWVDGTDVSDPESNLAGQFADWDDEPQEDANAEGS